jgi:uncharacterized protein
MANWTGLTRRAIAGALPALIAAGSARARTQTALQAEPFPMTNVRLSPSVFYDAVESNRRYLLALEPDRLLHNFRAFAGLTPKGAVYGGWESESLAGHTLGHYMSALSLMHAQTGDDECKRRVSYIAGELDECQQVRGDGYVAGLSCRRGDALVDGKILFEEVRKGDIRHNSAFDLNGGWSPLYTIHKLFAGLLDADKWCGEKRALPVAEKLGAYFEGVFAGLSDAQVEDVLDCEHGGINESFAELYARTGNRRWLLVAERLYHHKVLDPLADGRDELAYLHANTQIPKLVGLARLHEVTGQQRYGDAAAFFWRAVTQDRSYVIGGNSDREYFQAPRSTSKYITEQTCESCNSYNMLKLTRALYAAQPSAAYFDYYERAHFNHVLAQHNPATGMFSYMMPLMSGTHRDYSTPFNDFWCCCGTGLESHSKHGDSIYWRRGNDLFVNLFIPSTLEWKRGSRQYARLALETGYPFGQTVTLKVLELAQPDVFSIALRIPAWCDKATVQVNEEARAPASPGYASLSRRWHEGDVVTLTLPMAPRIEATPDDPGTIALLNGPLVLAADLGAADASFDGPAPALVSANVLGALHAADQPSVFRSNGIGRPGDLTFSPFFQQYARRNAVYFRLFDDRQWADEQARIAADAAARKALDARSTDICALGEEGDEQAHGLDVKYSGAVTYRGRKGRDARTGGFFEVALKTKGRRELSLRATYWGEERNRKFRILVDGTEIARQSLDAEHPAEFIDADYALPRALLQGKASVRIRFEPDPNHTAGPVFGCRLLTSA